MGVETLVAEPNENDFDALDKLCGEFRDQRGHPQSSKALALLDPRHGAEGLPRPQQTHRRLCRHRPLGALRPKAGQMPQKAAGRIVSLHFKNLNQMGPGTADAPTHDVPWGRVSAM